MNLPVEPKTAIDLLAVSVSVAAIVVSVISLFFSRSIAMAAEERSARRRMLEEDAKELGAAAYEAVAVSKVFLKKTGNESSANWIHKMTRSKGRLGRIRQRVRYSLFGLDGSIRALERYLDWIVHSKANDGPVDDLHGIADETRAHIDAVVLSCLQGGRLPCRSEIDKSAELAKKMDSIRQEVQVHNMLAEGPV